MKPLKFDFNQLLTKKALNERVIEDYDVLVSDQKPLDLVLLTGGYKEYLKEENRRRPDPIFCA